MKATMSMALSIATLVGSYGPLAEARAQNLVPNGSFEEYTECPVNVNQVYLASGWSSWFETPDYFNACSQTSWAGVPLNYVVDQLPSHGAAYCGFAGAQAEAPSDWGEFIAAELTQPLVPGVQVHVSIKLAAGIGGTISNNRYTCDRVGVRFTTTEQIWLFNPPPLPNYGHLLLQEPLPTGGEWYTLSGTFVPDSAYRFISIGRFYTWDSLQFDLINPDGNPNSPFAYFLVDEVCVTLDATDCDFGLSIAPVSPTGFEVLPNPFSDRFEIRQHGALIPIDGAELRDTMGKLVHAWRVTGSMPLVLDVPPIPNGLYLLRLLDARGAIFIISVARCSP